MQFPVSKSEVERKKMDDIATIRDAQRGACQGFKDMADEFDDHQKKLDKAKLSFYTTGAAGGIMAFVGVALILVTFGASIGLTIAGGVVGGLSAAGNIGSLIADKVLTSKTMKKALEKLTVLAYEVESVKKLLPVLLANLNGEDIKDLVKRVKRSENINDETKQSLFNRVKMLRKDISVHVSVISKTVKVVRSTTDVVDKIITLSIALSKASEAGKASSGMAAWAGAAANAVNVGRAAGTAADAGVDVAKTAGRVGLSGAKIATAGVGLAFDLGGIVFYSIKVHNQEPCEVAENIRKVARCLE